MAHRTARLNEYGRQLLVQRIVIEGWTVPTAAKAQGIRVPNAPAAGAATLPGGGYWPLAHAEHVAVGVLEPRTASRTDLGDEVDRLRRPAETERDRTQERQRPLGSRRRLVDARQLAWTVTDFA